MKTISKKIFVIAAAITLSACASIPEDFGRSDVNGMLNERGIIVDSSDAEKSAQLVKELTANPLTAETATRLALINNADLKKTYAELGIAAADVYKASRIHNPVFFVCFARFK